MNEAHKSAQKIYKNIYNSLNKIILYVRTSEIDFKHIHTDCADTELYTV